MSHPNIDQLLTQARAAAGKLEKARAAVDAALAERDRLIVALHDAGLTPGRIHRELTPAISHSGVRVVLLRAKRE